MLSSGIYEQIVNTRINTELAKLDPEQYDIQLEALDADDARRILTIYISYVIQQGLHYIRDSYPTSKDRESLLAQIRLCNDIVSEVAIHTKEPDFEDNQILEKGEILTSLYQKLNTARAIAGKTNHKVIRPETSIVENALFTGSKNEPSMLSELKKEILSSDDYKIWLEDDKVCTDQEVNLDYLSQHTKETLDDQLRIPTSSNWTKETWYNLRMSPCYSGSTVLLKNEKIDPTIIIDYIFHDLRNYVKENFEIDKALGNYSD